MKAFMIFMSPYFKELSPDEQKSLEAMMDSYSQNFAHAFRLFAIELLNADVNAKNSGEFVSVPPSTLGRVNKNIGEDGDNETKA